MSDSTTHENGAPHLETNKPPSSTSGPEVSSPEIENGDEKIAGSDVSATTDSTSDLALNTVISSSSLNKDNNVSEEVKLEPESNNTHSNEELHHEKENQAAEGSSESAAVQKSSEAMPIVVDMAPIDAIVEVHETVALSAEKSKSAAQIVDIVAVETVMNDDGESKVLENEKKNAVTQESSTMNTDGINDLVNQQENKSPPPYSGKSTESSVAPAIIPTDPKSHGLKHSMNGDDDMNYKTDNMIEIEPEEPPQLKHYFGQRHVFAFMAFLGLSAVYMMRINLSVAIVTMVNPNPSNATCDVRCDETCNTTAFSTFRHFHESFDDTTPDDGTCPFTGEVTPDTRCYEFDWTPAEKGNVLGAFFWGYMITQIPGGIMAERFGGKWVFFFGVLFTDLFCLLSPIAARSGGAGALIAVRMLTGLAEGFTFPTAVSMVSKWVPSLERSTIGAFVMAGTQFGTVISLPLSGWLCDFTEVDNGWPLTFYVPGAIGVFWMIGWVFLVYDNPSAHPRISEEEKRYITASTGKSNYRPLSATPWLTILTSIHLWAILVAHFGHSWGFSMLLTELPSYMSSILHFDIKSNGLLSALPYLAMWLSSTLFGIIADMLRRRGVLSTTATRKVFTTIGLLLPACGLVGATYTGCDAVGTIALLTLAAGFNGAVYSGFLVNHMDVASNFAGSMMGITNCVAQVCGFVVPAVVGAIVTDEAVLSQWQTMFYIAAGIYAGTNLFYVIFGTGVEQPWNKVAGEENTPNNTERNVDAKSVDQPQLHSKSA